MNFIALGFPTHITLLSSRLFTGWRPALWISSGLQQSSGYAQPAHRKCPGKSISGTTFMWRAFA